MFPPFRFARGAAITTRLTVTVPQGIVGGDLVRVAAPDGSYHSIMVPGGLTSGQQFSVELLATGSSVGNAAELQRLRVRAPAIAVRPLSPPRPPSPRPSPTPPHAPPPP